MGANGEPDRLFVEPTGGAGTPHSSGVFFARVLRNGPRRLSGTTLEHLTEAAGDLLEVTKVAFAPADCFSFLASDPDFTG